MGIKERERRVEVFFYGLFMDEELLRGKGLEPEGGEIAAIDGFALRIGQRAALVPTPGAKVYGLVFSLTPRSELDRLYSESSVQAYKPQAVLAHLASGGVVAAPLLQPSTAAVAYRTQSRIRREVACRLAEGWTPGRVHRIASVVLRGRPQKG
jgi:Gamma-glutamyl cyclotransferase, AIG2-like